MYTITHGTITTTVKICPISLRTSLLAQPVKNLPGMQETLVQSMGGEDPWRRNRLPIPVFLGFPGGSDSKETACNAGDLGLTPGLGRSPGGGKGYPLQYSGLENSMDHIVHGVTKSETWLRDFDIHFHCLGQDFAFKCRGCQFDPWPGDLRPNMACS